jgi:hypothetical protein
MSYRRVSNAEEALSDALSRFVPSEHIEGVVAAVKSLAEAVAEDQLDQDNRRGDYDPDL